MAASKTHLQQRCRLFTTAVWRLSDKARRTLVKLAIRGLREDTQQLVHIEPTKLMGMFERIAARGDAFLEWYVVIVAIVHSPTFYEHVAAHCIPQNQRHADWFERCRDSATRSLTQCICFQRADGGPAQTMAELLMFNLHHLVCVVLFEWLSH